MWHVHVDTLSSKKLTCQPEGKSNELVRCKGRVKRKKFTGGKNQNSLTLQGGFNLFALFLIKKRSYPIEPLSNQLNFKLVSTLV
jgi:hypothetical protein